MFILFNNFSMSRKTKEIALSPGQMLNHQRVRRIHRLDIVKLKTGMPPGTSDIMGISETRRPNNGSCSHMGATIYYFRTDDSDTHQRNGIGVIIKDHIKKSVRNVVAYSDPIILLQLAAEPINIIQASAPIADKPDKEVEYFYEKYQES